MAQASSIAVIELTRLLQADGGMPGAEIVMGPASAELLEKATALKYPSLQVYCERVINKLNEKFRTFAGTAELVVEVRVTHEHVEELHTQLDEYVQAVTDVLDRNRGTWMPGVFHAGTYEITFQPAKRGGKNFIQSARVRVETHVSLD